jgi:hypothetical protein
MKGEYIPLKQLSMSEGWKFLQELWTYQISEIEKTRDKCASKSSAKAESDWRYMAGQEKGFKLAMTALERALVEMEKEMESEKSDEKSDVEKMLEEITPR